MEFFTLLKSYKLINAKLLGQFLFGHVKDRCDPDLRRLVTRSLLITCKFTYTPGGGGCCHKFGIALCRERHMMNQTEIDTQLRPKSEN